MRLIKSIATLGFFTILSRITGFIRDILIASVLGAGPIADAFYVAFKFPNFFRRLFGEGAFNAAFIPTFSHFLAKEGKEPARQAASEVLSILFISLLILVVIVELTVPTILYIMAPGFSSTPLRMSYAIEFTRITFPYIMFASLAALYTGVLNTIYKFAVGAAAPIVLNVVMIIAMLYFEKIFETPGHALSWAVVIAGVGQYLWLHTSCQLNDFHLKLHRPTLTPPVRRVMKLMVPGSLAAGVIQLNIMIGIFFLSFLPEGVVSYFFYADRINQLPLSLVGVAISTALLPTLARHLSEGRDEEADTIQNRSMEFSLLLILPASAALIIIAEPIIQVLFERHQFTHSDTIPTARILASFAIGLPAYVLVKVFSTSFFARHDTKTPLMAATLAVIANIILNFLLIAPFQHIGIAIATSIASWVNAGWLAFKLKKIGHFKADARLKDFVPRVVASTMIMAMALEVVTRALSSGLYGGEMQRVLTLLIIVSTGIMVYGLACLVFRAVELKELKQYMRRRRS